uniref:Secreted protein n=1 Tax=Arundo donax TaxID=35708 RepID=A0A0A9D4G0_ARUDO
MLTSKLLSIHVIHTVVLLCQHISPQRCTKVDPFHDIRIPIMRCLISSILKQNRTNCIVYNRENTKVQSRRYYIL